KVRRRGRLPDGGGAARWRNRWSRAWPTHMRWNGPWCLLGVRAAFRLSHELRGVASGEAPEGRARHQAGAAAIVVKEQAPNHLARRIEPGNDATIKVLDLAILRDLHASESERHARGHVVGVERRRIERYRPVGLVDRKPKRPPSVEHVRIERHAAAAGVVVSAHSAQEGFRIDA